MATHHASPGEVVDLETWAEDVPHETSKAIVKTDDMELARLVIRAGQVYPNHNISSSIVVHCVRGEVEITVLGSTQTLETNQLMYLMPNEAHTVKAVVDSVVLLTIHF